MTNQAEITYLRQSYDDLVQQRAQINEQLQDIWDRLAELGARP